VDENLVDAVLRQRVTRQMDAYEPGTQVTSITPVTNQTNDGIASLEIDFAPTLQASPVRRVADAAVIKVGGSVVEVPANG
jgi:hypothetical protein